MTEPRTAAGRELLRLAMDADRLDPHSGIGDIRESILVIEAEASALDVERLAAAIASTFAESGVAETDRRQARKVVAEYDRLASADEEQA